MQRIAIAIIPFEYAVWLLPIAFMLIGIHKLAQKKGKIDGLFFTLSGLIFTTVAVSAKNYFIFHTNLFGLYKSFLFGNTLILGSYIFLLFGVREVLRTEEFRAKPPKRALVYAALLAVLALLPLSKNKPIVSVDLFVYIFIILITMYSVAGLFLLIQENKRKNSIFVALFAISLVTDLLLKNFAETIGISIQMLNVLKLFSYMFTTATATLLIFFVFIRAEIGRENQKKKPISIHKIEARFVKNLIIVYLITSIIFAGITYGTLFELQKVAKRARTTYAYTLSKDADISGNALEEKIGSVRAVLNTLSLNPSIIDMDQRGKDILINFYKIYEGTIASITRMNKKGIITFTYPYESSIGANISNQPHIKLLLKTHKAVLSEPIKTVQGFYAITYHTPIFKGDRFEGSLSTLFSLKNIGENVISTSLNKENIIIVSDNGTVIYPARSDIFLKNIEQIIPSYDNLPNTFVQSAFGTILAKSEKAYPFYNKPYTIIAFVPKQVVSKDMLKKAIPLLLILLTFILSFIIFIMLIMHAYEIRSREAEKLAGEESEKLHKTIDVFASANINESLEQFTQKLLKSALKLITNGDAGSIIVKEGKYYTYKAVEGFDKKLLGMKLSEIEIEIAKKTSAYIIQHIYNNTKYTGKSKALLKNIGTPRIQATIEAPLIVDGKYFGGIFIDSFKSINAFDSTDLKIANAISKLGSIYLKNRLLLQKEQNAEMDISFLISTFSELRLSMKEDEFFSRMLNSAKALVPQADGGSVTLRENSHFKYVAAFGYKNEIFNIHFSKETVFSPQETTAFVTDKINPYNKKHLDEKLCKAFERIGATKIKQTLVAPIVVNNQYMGGIFLDSFSEEKTFTEHEIKIANALSNLASAFVANKIVYNKLFEESLFNTASITLFHNVSLESSEEEVLKTAHKLLTALYPTNIEEVAIGEIVGNFIETIKFDGKNIVRHTFEIMGAIEEAIKDKRSVFIENSTHNSHLFSEIEENKLHRSEVVIFSHTKSVPIFRVRFKTGRKFAEEEREFFDRFGKEITIVLQSSILFQETKDAFISYIVSITNAINARDPYTRGHSERVAAYATLLAERMKLLKETIRKVALAGILHDVGKITVPREVLAKPGKLTKEEFEIIKQHTVRGYEIVEPIDPDIAEIVRAHHERMDGKGYPDGLKDDEIPFEARIITVADVYDALTTNRPYRNAFTHEKAIEIMKEEGGAHFDPDILDAFLHIPKEILEETKAHPNIIEKLRKYL